MKGFKKGLIQQINQQNEMTEMVSFHQEKLALGEHEYDLSKVLTYEQALGYIKKKLEVVVNEEIDDYSRNKEDGVIIQKNKTYLKERLERFESIIEEHIEEDAVRINEMSQEDFIKCCAAELVGHDVLADAFADDTVSDIFVYSWDKIYVESNGVNKLYPYKFRNEKHYANFVERLIKEVGTSLNQGEAKIVDFDLFGDRYCAVHQIVSVQSTSLTIRKHSDSHVRLSQIIKGGGMNQNMADLFKLIFKGQCNLIYAGITGSGKTTTLRALVDEYVTNLNRRVLTCEDTRELFLENKQTSELVTVKDKDPSKEVDLSRLVKTALRLKPKYILVGEVRGAEAEAAVEAAATGHSTSFTMHAEKPIDTINRLVINYQKAIPSLGSDIVERIVGEAIDYVAIQKNIPGIGRRVVSITEINFNYETGRVSLKTIMEYNYATDDFDIVGDISQDVINRMLGAGVKMEEVQNWRCKGGFI